MNSTDFNTDDMIGLMNKQRKQTERTERENWEREQPSERTDREHDCIFAERERERERERENRQTEILNQIKAMRKSLIIKFPG